MSKTTIKRKFWQFHLSTLVVGFLGLGVLLLLNIRVRQHYTFGSENLIHREQYFGWPLIACDHHRQWHTVIRNPDSFDEEEVLDEDGYYLDWPFSTSEARFTTYFEADGISPWRKSPFLIDLVSNSVILAVVILLCELLIRRREDRKT
jgi:hypothetical protein